MGGESRPPGAVAPRSECPALGRVPVPGFPSTGQRAEPPAAAALAPTVHQFPQTGHTGWWQ